MIPGLVLHVPWGLRIMLQSPHQQLNGCPGRIRQVSPYPIEGLSGLHSAPVPCPPIRLCELLSPCQEQGGSVTVPSGGASARCKQHRHECRDGVGAQGGEVLHVGTTRRLRTSEICSSDE